MLSRFINESDHWRARAEEARVLVGPDSRKSMRSFKEIICVDISEFESSHPSHAVSLWAMFRVTRSRRDPHAA
jgi:hypothetical protein